MHMNPYLSFDGTCEEAFGHYAKVLGGSVEAMMRYADAPAGEGPGEGCAPDLSPEKIMHARLRLGDRVLMASDSPPGMYRKPQGISVSLNLEDPKEAERIYAALSEGGQVMMALQETFWAQRFGMFTDRFGTPWMVNCGKEGF